MAKKANDRKKASSAKSKKGVKKAGSFKVPPFLAYLVPAFLFLTGQYFMFHSSPKTGITLSLLAVLLILALINGFSPTLPGVPKRILSLKDGALALCVAGAFVLGAMGQAQLIQSDNPQTLAPGLWLYFAAVVLLVIGFWPWRREGLSREKLPSRVEWVAFAVIMLIAIFFRTYQIKDIPAGLFIDEGFAGYGALKVLHEHWRFFYIPEPHQHPSMFIYLIALWFMVLSPTALHFTLFSVFMGLASLPFIYWTYRQWAGPRVALVSLFILSVMRWNVNFTRNSQRTELMPFFMFSSISFFLYGYQNGKRWAILTSAVFLGAGLYTYQSYKIFPFLIVLYVAYEAVANFKKFRTNWLSIAIAAGIFLLIASPLISLMVQWRSVGPREDQISMVSKIKAEHSLQPLIQNTAITALMFNRRGDPNPRHNLQDHRMLDDVTGVLFFLGVFYALSRVNRRKYFYALAGLAVMTLPCLLSTDAAHANRMMGTTPFICFLAAVPLGALWGRIRASFKGRGELVFALLLLFPLTIMAVQNYKTYFIEQANNVASWGEFSTAESFIGKAIGERGDGYEYYISPRYFNHYTISFLGYAEKDHMHPLRFPQSLSLADVPPGRGMFFALEQGRTGVMDALKQVFPGGHDEYIYSPAKQPIVYFYVVPASEVDKARGLNSQSTGGTITQAPQFPNLLPKGPFHGELAGSLYIDDTAAGIGTYRFKAEGTGSIQWWIDGKRVTPQASFKLCRGFHPVRFVLDMPSNKGPEITATVSNGRILRLGPSNFTTLTPYRGFKVSFYNSVEAKGTPALVEWEPVINFVNGNDFTYMAYPLTIHWSAVLKAPATGLYGFLFQSTGQGKLIIDHKQVFPSANIMGTAYLAKGSHVMEMEGSITGGWSYANLLWEKPGENRLTVLTPEVLAEVR